MASTGSAGKFHAVLHAGKSRYSVKVTDNGGVTWVEQLDYGEQDNAPNYAKLTSNEVTEDVSKTVPREEILAVSVIKNETTDLVDGIKLNYIVHEMHNVLRQRDITFTGVSVECQRFVDIVQDLINTASLRPKRALVFVNPQSGSKSGVDLYLTQVAPIFRTCGLHTRVVVTERASHAEEILSDFDLSTIDSIVVVGGDGTYHQVANGLMLRRQNEAGVDLNDPGAALQELLIPIGVIPGGTGNALTTNCYGTRDVETAALTIIQGRRKRHNVYSVFADGQFQVFAILLVGYGLWSDILDTSEARRYLGKVRHRVTLLEYLLFRQHRRLDLSIEYLEPVAMEEARASLTGASLTSIRGNFTQVNSGNKLEIRDLVGQKEWRKERKDVTAIVIYTPDVYAVVLDKNSGLESGGCLVNLPCSRWQLFKTFFRMVTFRRNFLEGGLAEHTTVYGARVKLHQSSSPGTDVDRKHVVLVDGECYDMIEPEFEVRLHRGIVKLFYGIEGIYWPRKSE